ncbi:Cysteine and histidine-rich domain-containing protein 1 [Toxocara canis]|uniref:Cysteine and histidine-rich domain-containing protein 1 n=1 Tax=Toxocara canis TaxID=6265 RepID=A0A0B2UHW1_TOXCA|nr:Cysteine and histidine-rich domain-containing protein 1 [Toxocara canis]
MEEELRYCYNKGCGQKFNPNENNADACVYHPGPAYFHDAYKIWNCCNKKSTDFGTWLSFKGCTRGRHNPEKPVEETAKPIKVETKIRPEAPEEVIVWNGLNKPAARDEAPRVMSLIRLEPTEAALKAIEARKELDEGDTSNLHVGAACTNAGCDKVIVWNGLNKPAARDEAPRVMSLIRLEPTEAALKAIEARKELDEGDTSNLHVGAACTNAGCDKVYQGEQSVKEKCVYHPGTAVFHEGMKYWSCCEKKTSDFGAFLEQKGCTTGSHCWSKNERVDKIREDWFCRSGYVHLNVYCKGALPSDCVIESNGLILRAKVVHGFGTKQTDLNYELFGEIDVPKCKNERVDKIREDWFCRSGYVHLNVYCKGALPSDCVIESNGLILRAKVVHGFGTKQTDLNYELFGEIDVPKCKDENVLRYKTIALAYQHNTTKPLTNGTPFSSQPPHYRMSGASCSSLRSPRMH